MQRFAPATANKMLCAAVMPAKRLDLDLIDARDYAKAYSLSIKVKVWDQRTRARVLMNCSFLGLFEDPRLLGVRDAALIATYCAVLAA